MQKNSWRINNKIYSQSSLSRTNTRTALDTIFTLQHRILRYITRALLDWKSPLSGKPTHSCMLLGVEVELQIEVDFSECFFYMLHCHITLRPLEVLYSKQNNVISPDSIEALIKRIRYFTSIYVWRFQIKPINLISHCLTLSVCLSK